jgi:hypothetical protein
MRFRYDNPIVYFQHLPAALTRLDPNLGASLLPAWCATEASTDLCGATLGLSIPYWQESPQEPPHRQR